MVEFVSANPTGPMHMGNARRRGSVTASPPCSTPQARRGASSTVNDAGNQLDKFGLSLSIRYQQLFAENPPELPEDSYHGEDILDLAKEYAADNGDALMRVSEEERRAALVGFGLPRNIAKMKADMEKYRVHYDRWFLESDLHKSGEVMAVVDYLRDRGLTYEKDGAVWYKATEFGGERTRCSSAPTATRLTSRRTSPTTRIKFDRGFDLLIDIWGSDHRGHVARMKGAMDAVGQSADKLEIILMQFVRLMRNGEIVRMSKRTGKAIQLGDLLNEVPLIPRAFSLICARPTPCSISTSTSPSKRTRRTRSTTVQYAHARI